MPFTSEQFLEIFKIYNESVWPMQIFFYLIGIINLYLIFKKQAISAKVVNYSLALLWLWMGSVYHILNFSSINKAAYVFGLLNIVQSVIIISYSLKGRLSYYFKPDLYTITGLILITYALVIYPIIGYLSGHQYPYSPTFGLPCPTTIFTFGIFLLSDKKFPFPALIIPLVWSIIGFTAAFKLGIKEDIGLLAAGIIGTILIILRDKKSSSK